MYPVACTSAKYVDYYLIKLVILFCSLLDSCIFTVELSVKRNGWSWKLNFPLEPFFLGHAFYLLESGSLE